MSDVEKSQHIILVACIGADGEKCRSLVILPKLKYFPDDLRHDMGYFHWASTESGWIETVVFEDWLEKVFLPHVKVKRFAINKPDGAALLWLDGHKSRVSAKAMQLLKDNKVTVISFPGHTSHVTQPLDNGVFAVFKKALAKYYKRPDDTSVPSKRKAIIDAAVEADHHAGSPKLVVEAFKKCGLVPFDPEIVIKDPTRVRQIKGEPQSTSDKKRKRGHSISAMVLTNDEAIESMKTIWWLRRKSVRATNPNDPAIAPDHEYHMSVA